MARQSRSQVGPTRHRSPSTKTVLVTGGSRGIGRAICRIFGQSGWQVGVHYRERKAEALDTLDLIQTAGGTGSIYQADVRHADQVAAMVDAFCRDHAHLDVMICNAGTAASALVVRQSVEEWERVIETNLTGVFHCLQAAAPRMVEQKAGSIIIIGSYAGLQGTMGQAAYAASKAGLFGLMKTAALELGPSNVRVNLVLPGWQKTDLASHRLPEGEALHDHCLGRTPNLEEVAKSVVHLAQLEDVAGQVWNLDSRIL